MPVFRSGEGRVAENGDFFCNGTSYEDNHGYRGSLVFPPYSEEPSVEFAKPFHWACHMEMMDLRV